MADPTPQQPSSRRRAIRVIAIVLLLIAFVAAALIGNAFLVERNSLYILSLDNQAHVLQVSRPAWWDGWLLSFDPNSLALKCGDQLRVEFPPVPAISQRAGAEPDWLWTVAYNQPPGAVEILRQESGPGLATKDNYEWVFRVVEAGQGALDMRTIALNLSVTSPRPPDFHVQIVVA